MGFVYGLCSNLGSPKMLLLGGCQVKQGVTIPQHKAHGQSCKL